MSRSTAMIAVGVGLMCLSLVGGGAAYALNSGGTMGGFGGSAAAAAPPTTATSSAASPAAADQGGYGSDPGTPVPHTFRLAAMPMWLTASNGKIVTAAATGNLQMRNGLCDSKNDGINRYGIYDRDRKAFLLHNGRGGMTWGSFSSPEGCFIRETARCDSAYPGKGFEVLRSENGGQKYILRVANPRLGAAANLAISDATNYNANNLARMSEVCLNPSG